VTGHCLLLVDANLSGEQSRLTLLLLMLLSVLLERKRWREMTTPCNSHSFPPAPHTQVALWAWDIVVDNCAICRNHIMDLCESSEHFFQRLSFHWRH
jgi:hypothetical protein